MNSEELQNLLNWYGDREELFTILDMWFETKLPLSEILNLKCNCLVFPDMGLPEIKFRPVSQSLILQKFKKISISKPLASAINYQINSRNLAKKDYLFFFDRKSYDDIEYLKTQLQEYIKKHNEIISKFLESIEKGDKE